ncbi:MAG: creatininase family protein, partial [Alphaproteobacteria bacterium]
GLPHRMAEVYSTLTAAEETAFGWMAQDLHAEGVVGDAASADAETGRRLVRHAAERLVELLHETDRFEPDFLGR